MKRLQHPRHGFAFAHNAIEEATMRANGWTDESAEPAAAPRDNEQQATNEAQAPEGVAPARKPGRPRKAE